MFTNIVTWLCMGICVFIFKLVLDDINSKDEVVPTAVGLIIAGSAVFFITPIIASVLLTILKIIFWIAVIGFILYLLGG